jgi:hypothetical protein
MDTLDEPARLERTLSGIRQGLLGTVLLFAGFGVWEARSIIANLATTRVVATAVCSTSHGATEAQLRRAYAEAIANSSAEAELTADDTFHDSYYLRVTADTPERAKADLAVLAERVTAAFPSADRHLMVSVNNSTVPSPNERSRRIALALQAVALLMLLGGQLLVVVGAYREGAGRLGLLAALATPFALLFLPSGSGSRRSSLGTALEPDWNFVLLLLALTPISIGVGLWLTRTPHRAARGRNRRAVKT